MTDSEQIAAIVDAALDDLHGETRLQALIQEFSTLEIMDDETNAFEVLLQRNEMPAFFRLYHACPKKEFVLLVVAQAGNVELMWQLIKAGADPDYALYGAARANNIELIRKLIHYGANRVCAINGAGEYGFVSRDWTLYHKLMAHQFMSDKLLVLALAHLQGAIIRNEKSGLIDFLNEFEDEKTQKQYASLLVRERFYQFGVSQLLHNAQIKKYMGSIQLSPALIKTWASLEEGSRYWLLYGSTRSLAQSGYILLRIATYLLPSDLVLSDLEIETFILAARFNILGKPFIIESLLNYIKKATKAEIPDVKLLLKDVKRTKTIEELLVTIDKKLYAKQNPATPAPAPQLWTYGKNKVLGIFNSAPTPAVTLTAVLQFEKDGLMKRFDKTSR